METHSKVHKGRGATLNPDSRFQQELHEVFHDGWDSPEDPAAKLATTITPDNSRTVITYNQSPDLPFDRSINPYRGCEHGCPYCFARPSHAYLGLSPGLDFESRLIVKPGLITLLRRELQLDRYRCQTIALGTNTDPYQPVEKELLLIRKILQLFLDCRQPVSIVTKSALIERDIDLLTKLAEHSLVEVTISITTLDKALARKLKPRAAAPARRLATIARLAQAGIPTGALVAPVIPQLNDAELENILEQAAVAGISAADYALLRLPGEVSEIFTDWLHCHYPLRAERVLNAIRQTRNGRINDSRFGRRLRGQGPYAEMLAQRFKLQSKRLGLRQHGLPLSTDNFRAPINAPGQRSLSEFE